MRSWYVLLACFLVACEPSKKEAIVIEEELAPGATSGLGPEFLSDYGLYRGDMKDLEPAADVHGYEINAPLFSDYAFKKRLIRLPKGQKATYQPGEVFDFPEGTMLIKNFYYPTDFRKPEGQRRLMETRLLVLKEKKWEALTYVWNESQTDARLEVAGRVLPVSWTQEDGMLQKIHYAVPDLNQCRGCHLKGDRIMPIGPSARQLNRGDQLADWQAHGMLDGLPAAGSIPKLASYEDVSVPIADRARSWLEINCAHCHRPDGQGKTSGLHLSADVTSLLELGVGKPPVAAGRGSGGRAYSIVPGNPDESILLYRIESTDPGVMMPEVGRKLVHKEGVDLVRQWILSMK